MTDLFEELQWRGIVYGETEGTHEVLATRKVTGYIGFDPSAASLHVGSLLPIMSLVHMQRHGHTPIVLLGGGTGLIGDPSGKTQERLLLSKDAAKANIEGIRLQLSKFLDFESKPNPAIMDNNVEWLSSLNLLDFLRDVGKHFTINYMLDKESVTSRMEAGMSFTEFNYMLLQAYDFLVLHERYGCELQMGGSDQWGNITSGIDLIRRVSGHRAYGLVTPLLQTSSGTKFGKTGSGTVWLDPKLTSPYRFYQFWVNTDDKDVLSYLKYFTLLDREEVEEMSDSLKRSPEKREAQIKLATEVTKMVHGEEALKKAQHASSALFSREIQGLSKEDIIDIFADTPSMDVPSSRFIQEQIPVLDLVTECSFVSSKGEARRLIRSGGLYINNQKIIGEQSRVSLQESIGGTFFVLRRGAKNFHLVRIVSQ